MYNFTGCGCNFMDKDMEIKSRQCRVCLKIEKPRKLLSLYDHDSQIIERIFLISGVTVKSESKNFIFIW